MTSPAPSSQQYKQSTGNSLLLVLVVFLCSAAIGLSGYIKIRLDDSATRLSKIEMVSPQSSADPLPTGAIANQKIEEVSLSHSWSTIQTMLSWLGFLFAAVMAMALAFNSRGRSPETLDMLSKSVTALAQGDLSSRIWGIERRDSIGDLARAIDAARITFSQLPDLNLTNEQGKILVRLEGESKPLFQSLINSLGERSNSLQQASQNLTSTTAQQQEIITLLSSRVEAVLSNIEKREMENDRLARDNLAKVMTSAQQLRHAQEHAADQLNRILPFLQDRAQGLAEMAQITGKHLAQALQSITTSERGLANSATQSEQAIQKLSSTADNLGERLFGAVNLLQASGKVLTETTEQTQSKLSDAIGRLDQGLASLTPPQDVAAVIDEKISSLTATMIEKIEQLNPADSDNTTTLATDEMKAQLINLNDQLQDLRTLLATLPTSGKDDSHEKEVLNQIAAHILDVQNDITATFDKTLVKTLSNIFGQMVDDAYAEKLMQKQGGDPHTHNFAAELQPILADSTQELRAQITKDMASISADITATFDETLVKTLGQIVGQSMTQTIGETLAQKLDEKLPALTAGSGEQDYSALLAPIRQQWFQMAGQIEATRASLEDSIAIKLKKLEEKLATAPKSGADGIPSPSLLMIEQQTAILTELVSTMAILDKNLQNMEKRLLTGLGRVA